ncbi:response regulator [Flavobacterium sp.]|uniref:response regulator n=1 Tax=Flavobacterium sp. TaxID=239 RepID=UPI0026109579|nr:response regulator [Flavobacterium sp.]
MPHQKNTAKNIFLSDDDADDCMLFSEALQEIYNESEARLTIVNDGMALMEVLEETVPPPPEVIFLDINMPKKNGVECLQEIRSTPKLAGIPIIIFSTSSNKDIVDKTYLHGANYYICKPQSYLLLKKTIELVLSFDFERLSQRPVRESFVIKVA